MSRIRLACAAAAGLTLTLALTACGAGSDPLSTGSTASSSSSTIAIGSANFAESELLGEIYAQALEAKNVKVKRSFNIGARELYLKALQDGSIDLLPEYNGALLSALAKGGAPEGVTTPADVLTVGAGPEWAERYQGLKGLKSLYGVQFKKFKPLDAGGPLTMNALIKGNIDVGNIFSTDSGIATNKLVVLQDPRNLYLAENILPLIRTQAVNPTVTAALNAVSAKLTTANLTTYLARVQVDKQDSATVAKAFLTDNGLV
jgi:osmoprotectant transport system substrate-binding protein